MRSWSPCGPGSCCHIGRGGTAAGDEPLSQAWDVASRAVPAADGQVAIFDATNSTHERRQQLINKFHGKVQYMFIESICNDNQVGGGVGLPACVAAAATLDSSCPRRGATLVSGVCR